MTLAMLNEGNLEARVEDVNKRVGNACQRVGRSLDSVKIVGASKTQSAEEIRRVATCGIRDFGENYLQEAEAKILALQDLAITWHFIGRIQSNKTKLIAQYFDWVHTVDRASIARRLSNARLHSCQSKGPLNICIQVNIDCEEQKAGLLPDELEELIRDIQSLPCLRLRGLMAIPKATQQGGNSQRAYRQIKTLFEKIPPIDLPHWDTLSMGMSSDFDDAIVEGATILRLGTSIFGPR